MLFKVQKTQVNEQPATAGKGTVDPSDQLATPSPKLSEVLALIDHGRTIHWVSEGDWSMHQLLEALLERTGPAEVWISSYAFSELPARTIANLRALGTISRLHCIIDSRIDVRSASALTILRNTSTRLKLCHTHAKVTILKNKEWLIAVSGSANYTVNKRYEAGMITTDPTVSSFHLKWISNELQQD